jgi:hypothetical protein
MVREAFQGQAKRRDAHVRHEKGEFAQTIEVPAEFPFLEYYVTQSQQLRELDD